MGTRDRRDNHPGVCLREERQVQFVDYPLKSSMFYKNVRLQATGRNLRQKSGARLENCWAQSRASGWSVHDAKGFMRIKGLWFVGDKLDLDPAVRTASV